MFRFDIVNLERCGLKKYFLHVVWENTNKNKIRIQNVTLNYLFPSRSAWTMKQSFIKYLLLSASFHLSLQENKPCVQRDLGHSSFVCVCNSTYCDTYDKIEGTSCSVQKIKKKQWLTISATSELVGWVSDRRSERLSRYPVSWQSNNETVGVTIDINK